MKRSLLITISSVLAVSALVGTGLAYWNFKKDVTKDALATTSFNLEEHLGTDLSATKKARLVFDQNDIVLTDQSNGFTGSESSYTPISDYSIQYKGSDASSQTFTEGYLYISKELYPYLFISENGRDLFTATKEPTGLNSDNLPADCYYLPLFSLPNRYDSATNTRTVYDYDLTFKYTKKLENVTEYETFQNIVSQSTLGFAFKKTEGDYYVVNFHDHNGVIIQTKTIAKDSTDLVSYDGKTPSDEFGFQETGTNAEYKYIAGKNYVFKDYIFHVFDGWTTTPNGSDILLKPGKSLSSEILSVNNVPLDLYPSFSEQTNRVGFVQGETDQDSSKAIFTAVDDQLGENSTMDPLYLTLNEDGTASLLLATPGWQQQFPDGKVSLRDSYMGIPLTSIEDGAFTNGTDIKELTIPGSVVRIGSTDPSATGAFENCSNMTTVTINAGDIESIGCNTFKNCTSLINVNLPDGLTEIHDNAFQMVDKVKEMRLPDTLRYIGDRAFLHMNDLQRSVIPASVEYIGVEAFAECVNMTELSFDSPCTSENGMIIKEKAFRNCQKVSSLILPEGLTSIGDECFSQCYDQLTTISFPSSMEHFGKNIFSNLNGNYTMDLSKLTNLMNPDFDIGEEWFADSSGTHSGGYSSHTIILPCSEADRSNLPGNLKNMFCYLYKTTYQFTDKTVTMSQETCKSYWSC